MNTVIDKIYNYFEHEPELKMLFIFNDDFLNLELPLTKIVGGILCSSNTYTHNNNTTIIKEIKRLEGLKGLDLGCIADYGSFFVEYSGEEIITEIELLKMYILAVHKIPL